MPTQGQQGYILHRLDEPASQWIKQKVLLFAHARIGILVKRKEPFKIRGIFVLKGASPRIVFRIGVFEKCLQIGWDV
jgi:hypothetical protein